MNTTEIKNPVEQQSKFNQKISNRTDQDLRLKISKKEEMLAELESRHGKNKEEYMQLGKVEEELKLLLQQLTIPFRLTNSIWFNRPNSIFFSTKNDSESPNDVYSNIPIRMGVMRAGQTSIQF